MSDARKSGLSVVGGTSAPSASGRVPPHDLVAESAVLSAVLLELGALDRVQEILKPEFFYSPANKRIFEACIALTKEGSPIDVVTVGGWLKARERLAEVGGVPYLATIVDAAPSVANLEAYAALVRDRHLVRKVIAICQEGAATGYGAPAAGPFLGELSSALQDLETAASTGGYFPGRAGFEGAWAKIAAAHAPGGQAGGLLTGFRDLDYEAGPIEPQEYVIIAGRPGMGKSALGGAIGVNVASSGEAEFAATGAGRRGALIATFEMPKEQISRRQICSEAGVDIQRAKRGELTKEELTAAYNAHVFLSGLPLAWVDVPTASPFELEAHARRFRSELLRSGGDLAVVIVDYLQLGTGEGDSAEQKISDISRGLKAMAKRLRCPVVALAQLNREVENRPSKKPILPDLRGSGALEQDADRIYFVYREEYYERGKRPGVCDVIVAKNRDGPSGFEVPLAFHAACARFDNLNDQTAASPGR